MRNGPFWSNVVFEKEVIFHYNIIWISFRDLDFEIPKLNIWEHKTSCDDKGIFYFHYYLANSTTNWVQIFTGFLFYAYIYYAEIHQLRKPVFVTYQRCPVSLKVWPPLVIIQNLLFGNEHALQSFWKYKTLWETIPSEHSFWERGNFSLK